MVATVVDSSNLIEFVQTGKVPAFKPPEPAKPAGGAAPAAGSQGIPGTSPESPPQQQRGADGKFTAAKEGDTTSPAAPKAPATGDDGGEKDLTEVVRQKINTQHRLRKEAEERERRETLRAIEAERRAEQLQRELEASRPKSGPPSEPQTPKEPKPEDFTTVQEYTDALVSYRVDQRLREKDAQAKREAEQTAAEARAREFGKRIAETRTKHEDFDEVLGSIKNTDLDRVHADVTEYLQESDHGGELLYHLAKNPDVLDRLRKLTPRKFIAELGKLETKFEAQAPSGQAGKETPTLTQVAAPASAPVSKAPAPIAPLDTAGIAPVAKKPEEMTVAELREYRRQQERQKRANGR